MRPWIVYSATWVLDERVGLSRRATSARFDQLRRRKENRSFTFDHHHLPSTSSLPFSSFFHTPLAQDASSLPFFLFERQPTRGIRSQLSALRGCGPPRQIFRRNAVRYSSRIPPSCFCHFRRYSQDRKRGLRREEAWAPSSSNLRGR